MKSSIIDLQSSHFTFSQGSLQAYKDCPRLFHLRYLERLAWPAPEVDSALEYEEHILRGVAFHKLVQQYFSGIPVGRLEKMSAVDPRLSEWWINFMEGKPDTEAYTQNTEISLSVPLGRHRLVAKYDLVFTSHPAPLLPGDGSLGKDEKTGIIYDWKTNEKRPKREWLKDKMQTRVYPFVLAQAGGQLNDGDRLEPDDIEMVYWFSNFPAAPMRFQYSQENYLEDEANFTQLVEEISSLGETDFLKTENVKRCSYCVYRSLCDRGVEAGVLEGVDSKLGIEVVQEEVFDFGLDFDQIAEIEF